ncbi:hypothetical protein NEMBOFW57_005588 [Staphylotrichum longicolle]|uniref:Uncharacterized protein n=1 Tax=Staphylotrichum longicolle TaxID=669026 RepID=A0AAD4F1R0_9PEZI|nr:hypothetical protein NEMBOFW57_005588 [Staphylotrichum longicolle]
MIGLTEDQQVRWAYHYEPYNLNVIRSKDRPPPDDDSAQIYFRDLNGSVVDKRDSWRSNYWELSQISTPRGTDWYAAVDYNKKDWDQSKVNFYYYLYGSGGEGQYIYVAEDGIWENNRQ